MPDPYTRAANAREKARQEKNQWKARARKAEQLLAAIRELHTSLKPDSDGEHYLDPLTRKPKCGECLLIYPCPTIRALDGD